MGNTILFVDRYALWTEALHVGLVLLATWGATRILKRVLINLAHRFGQRTKTRVIDYIFKAIQGPLIWITTLLGVYIVLHHLPLKPSYYKYIDGIIFIVASSFVTFLAIRTSTSALNWYVEKMELNHNQKLEVEFIPLADKCIKILIFIAGAGVILQHFSIDVRSLIVTLGVGSLAIGLALQETLANMIAGFIIMIDRPFRISDYIQLSSGESGEVIKIGIRSTRIKTAEHTVLIVPNSALVKNPVTNYSFPDKRTSLTVSVKVKREADLVRAKQLVEEAARDVPQILKEPPPTARFVEFGDGNLVLQLTAWIDDYKKKIETLDLVNQNINERFKSENIM